MTGRRRGLASIAAMLGARKLTAVAAIAAATTLAACGGDSEPEPSIPLEDAEALVATLDEIRANVDAGSCTVASGEVQEFEDELNQLPGDVDDEVRDQLQRGALHLAELVDEQCDEPEPETTTEETQTQEPTEEPTTTEETTTEEPTTDQTETEPDQQPPGGGQGPGGTGGLGPAGGGE